MKFRFYGEVPLLVISVVVNIVWWSSFCFTERALILERRFHIFNLLLIERERYITHSKKSRHQKVIDLLTFEHRVSFKWKGKIAQRAGATTGVSCGVQALPVLKDTVLNQTKPQIAGDVLCLTHSLQDLLRHVYLFHLFSFLHIMCVSLKLWSLQLRTHSQFSPFYS